MVPPMIGPRGTLEDRAGVDVDVRVADEIESWLVESAESDVVAGFEGAGAKVKYGPCDDLPVAVNTVPGGTVVD